MVHFYIGEVLYNRGLNDEALAALERAIARQPDNPDAHYLMGFVLGDMGRHDEARQATKRAIQLNPTLSRAQTNLSLDQSPVARTGAVPPPSDRRTTAAMSVADEGALAHFNLGLAFRQKGYYAEALREYEIALERGEERALVQQAVAELHLLRKDVAAAIAAYDGLLEGQPESPKLWNERGVALHQDGRYSEAAESYRRAIGADPNYAIAHNNLGVALYHAGDVPAAVDAFRQSVDRAPVFAQARLNLALLLFKGKRLQLSLEAYRRVLTDAPEHAVAWNGIGLVLTELREFEEARNAFARAVQIRPNYAEAHYNLSFTLSNLGDFDAALRETKRALELDPYYVPQKFELAIDLQYEHPDLSIVPALDGAGHAADAAVTDFSFDTNVLDSLFSQLAPPPPERVATPKTTPTVDPYGMAADYLSKGLYERAGAEVSRAMLRGGDRSDGLALLGDVFARRGLYGEALERYREAREAKPQSTRALMGEVRALVALGRSFEAGPLADQLVASAPDDVDTLLVVAAARSGAGEIDDALLVLTRARAAAPDRVDVLQLIGDVTRQAGDAQAALSAYRDALALAPDRAVVRYEVARLLAAAGQQQDAEAELLAALDQVPTYADAALALAELWRLTGRASDAMQVLIEMLERDMSHSAALLALGELLFDAGRRRDAACAFARLASVDPDHPGGLYYQGAILAEQHRYREAIEHWDRVILLEPDGPYGRRARHDRRSAADLARILVRRGGAHVARPGGGGRTPAQGVAVTRAGPPLGRAAGGGGGSR